jgi:predicted nucleic acid-binding protein
MNAVDTNVLLYSIDHAEPVKRDKARRLLQQLESGPDPTVTLWQVIGEVTQQLRRWQSLGRMSGQERSKHIETFRWLFPLVMPEPVAFDLALDLAERYSLSHWDSMLLGACKSAGVTTLFTEDIGAPRTIDDIELRNPFA